MMFVLYYKTQSIVRLVLFCMLAAIATVITLQIKPESFFRCLTVCFAFLPKIAFKTDFKVSPFDFTGFKAFAQVVIMYSDFLLLFAPAALILIVVAVMKDEKKDVWQILKKFIPCAVIMLLCFLASAFYNPVANLCLFVFTYAAIIPVTGIAERHVYKNDRCAKRKITSCFQSYSTFYIFCFYQSNNYEFIIIIYEPQLNLPQLLKMSIDTGESGDENEFIFFKCIHLVNNVTNDFLKEDMLTKTIQITYKSAEHDDDGFKTKTYSKSFDNYTKDKKFILKEALNFFDATYKNQKIRLIGFTLKNLVNKHDITVQMTFDDYMVHESENKTQLLINQLNRDYNKEIFMRLSDLKDKKNEN